MPAPGGNLRGDMHAIEEAEEASRGTLGIMDAGSPCTSIMLHCGGMGVHQRHRPGFPGLPTWDARCLFYTCCLHPQRPSRA
jgi:hypothetical protein